MIDSNELLAFGAALVQTVRNQIKYSENIKSLYEGYEETNFYHARMKKVSKLVYSSTDPGQASLDSGVGYCDDLCSACLYIARNLNYLEINNFYLSLLATPSHVFILAHDSPDIDKLNMPYNHGQMFKESLADLSNDDRLTNAIIIDPWIYKASKLTDLKNHLNHTNLFGVMDFYEGRVEYKGENVYILQPQRSQEYISPELSSIFDSYYSAQKRMLEIGSNSFGQGRRFSDVRRSLEYNIQQQLQLLSSLRDFFTRLNNQSSYWYSHLGHSDNKGTRINEAVTYLNDCINNYNYPGEDKLLNLFQCILRILPIVRLSNTTPRNLDIYSINMTKSAKGIFNLAVTPQEKYIFEEITGLNLDWIRNARNSYNNDRTRYMILLNKITEFTAPNNLDEILCNFYENKNGYYQLVRDAITH